MSLSFVKLCHYSCETLFIIFVKQCVVDLDACTCRYVSILYCLWLEWIIAKNMYFLCQCFWAEFWKKMGEESCVVVLIAPNWPRQAWFFCFKATCINSTEITRKRKQNLVVINNCPFYFSVVHCACLQIFSSLEKGIIWPHMTNVLVYISFQDIFLYFTRLFKVLGDRVVWFIQPC